MKGVNRGTAITIYQLYPQVYYNKTYIAESFGSGTRIVQNWAQQYNVIMKITQTIVMIS